MTRPGPNTPRTRRSRANRRRVLKLVAEDPTRTARSIARELGTGHSWTAAIVREADWDGPDLVREEWARREAADERIVLAAAAVVEAVEAARGPVEVEDADDLIETDAVEAVAT